MGKKFQIVYQLKKKRLKPESNMSITFKEWQKNLQEMNKADVPAYLRKKKGEEPLTLKDVKGPRPDSISSKEALAKSRNEELKGNQHKLDKNKNGKLDAHDFKLLRKEESEELDEISKSTLGSYVKKATVDSTISRKIATDFDHRAKSAKKQDMKDVNTNIANDFKTKSFKRQDNINKAVDRLTKEETDLEEACGYKKPMEEGEMTDTDMKQREKIVKGMKKNYKDFVAKYGDKAKSVMYATATKMAMKEAKDEEEDEKDEVSTADKKVGKDGRKYSAHKIVFNKGEEDGKHVTEELAMIEDALNEEITYFIEAMIDYSDFQGKLDSYKKAGIRVVDYKHGSDKAHIITIDKEGVKRKINFKPTGVSMQNLGKHEGEDTDDEGSKVKKGDNQPAVKRGRGRPKGSASGARQQGTGTKKEYGGLPFHSLNLPNRNK